MADAKILIVDDEAVIREGIRRILEKSGFSVEATASGRIALENIQEEEFDVVITDLKMPGMSGMEVLKNIKILQPAVPVIIITGYATVETAVEAIKNGAFDYLSKPFTPDQILSMVNRALEQKKQMPENLLLQQQLSEQQGFEQFIGDSPQMQKVYRRILQVAPTDSTVLITGESGTGKELVARAIHNNSPRKGQPFVALDCTSLAESLLESELFGHEKGSFTGAVQTKMGLFKVADGGTLFLDEVSNIGTGPQAKLLRVIQERVVTPIGGTKPIPINIRLIAATNRSLKEMVTEGSFREDLYFRLNTIPIDLPPLRERKGDLKLLVAFFLRKFAEDMGKTIAGMAPGAMATLERYPFPGNVRELEHIIERAVVLAEGEYVGPEDLELPINEHDELGFSIDFIPKTSDELKETKRKIREEAVKPIEKAFVLEALKRNNWNITKAAEEVGMLRPNFQALLKKLDISVRERSVQS